MMNRETIGTVTAVSKQWWLKVNTKPVRLHAMDGATFPHIITVQYEAQGKTYTRRKWISAGLPAPSVGAHVRVAYCAEKPQKSKVL